MAEAVVSMVVETLGNLLIEEAKFIHGVGDQVRNIRDELQWMRCFLKDADARQYEDERVRNWVREIKEIAYDAGDVLESFILGVESRWGRSILKVLKRYACIVNEGIVRHKVGSKIEAIQTRILNLTTRLQTYGIKSLSEERGSLNYVNQRQIQLRRAYSHVDQDDFVGLEEDVEKLVECLVNDDDRKVVAICGMGGLGKTTLAKKVYHHEKVKSHFQAHVWVCISQEWQPTTILQQILVKLTPGDHNRHEDTDSLIRKIFNVQREKKCLVILDDIWHEDAWDMLKAAFPMSNMGGKLLLTSRNIKVAEHVDTNVFVHKPRTLSEEECLKLLKKKAFTMGDDTAVKEKEELANEMIKECKGLPLAVIVLGGVLASKQSLNEWKRMHQSIKSYIIRGEGIGQHDRGVLKVLGLSYDDLPYQLKPCFLYLGKFKEDTEIKTEKLYQLWIAESMVLSEDRREGETLMDVAEGYLDELAQRCMVQVQLAEEHDGLGKFKSCRLHDLMRDLSLSNGKEENFFQIFHFQHENNPPDLVESSSSFTSRTRRVVVYLDDEENTNSRKFPLDEETSQGLRSLFFFIPDVVGKGSGMPRMVKSHLNDFKMLRVLAIERLGFSDHFNLIEWAKLPHDHLALSKVIGKLIHLRYFSLSVSDFFTILSSIKNLKHLQTLYLEGLLYSSLPCNANVLGKMRRLQHLYLPPNQLKVFKPSKLQFDGLSNLETLENFDSFSCDSKGLCELINLRKLTAKSEDLEVVERIIDYLSSTAAKHMRYSQVGIYGRLDFDSEEGRTVLTKILRCGHLTELKIKNGTCTKLPRYDEVLNFSQSLTKVTLYSLYLKEDPMPTLEKLPNLQVLSLEYDAFNEKTMVCSENGFPQLKSLILGNMNCFENWRVEEGAMPKLSRLQLSWCKSLKAVPDGLRFITTLRELEIGGMMNGEFKRRVKVVDGEEGEDFDKIRHVTSVVIK